MKHHTGIQHIRLFLTWLQHIHLVRLQALLNQQSSKIEMPILLKKHYTHIWMIVGIATDGVGIPSLLYRKCKKRIGFRFVHRHGDVLLTYILLDSNLNLKQFPNTSAFFIENKSGYP